MDLAMAKSSAKIKAYHTFSTSKPLTSQSARMMMKALINNKKIPSVIMVIGNVRSINIGFTIKFNTERATHTAVRKPSIVTPGRM
jgi:hypothetical protein